MGLAGPPKELMDAPSPPRPRTGAPSCRWPRTSAGQPGLETPMPRLGMVLSLPNAACCREESGFGVVPREAVRGRGPNRCPHLPFSRYRWSRWDTLFIYSSNIYRARRMLGAEVAAVGTAATDNDRDSGRCPSALSPHGSSGLGSVHRPLIDGSTGVHRG